MEQLERGRRVGSASARGAGNGGRAIAATRFPPKAKGSAVRSTMTDTSVDARIDSLKRAGIGTSGPRRYQQGPS